ncbi:MAG: efflux RND transporter periplasmic adaptor subunit [Acidobacteriota bacterium]
MRIIKGLIKGLAPLLVLAAGAYGAWYLVQTRPPVETKPPEVILPLVRTQTAVPQSVQFKVQAQGTVAPRTESALVSEVAGRVIEVSPSLADGAFFEAGDLLLRIEPHDFELTVVRTRAEVARAEHRLEIEKAEAEVARREWESLGGGEKPSPLVLRQPQLAEARAALASAQAVLKQAQRNLERTVLRAPYAGRVRQKSVDVGQYVTVGSALARLYSVDYAEVRLPIPDRQLAFVRLPFEYRNDSQPKAGPRVRLSAEFAGKRHHWWGRIVRTEGEIDPQSRMIHAVAQVEDPYGRQGPAGRPPLAVGLFVQAEIYGKQADGVFILPRAALRGPGRMIVVDSDNRLRFRQVEVLRSQGEQVIISSGLEEGERVLLSPLDTAVEGMRVRTDDEENRGTKTEDGKDEIGSFTQIRKVAKSAK